MPSQRPFFLSSFFASFRQNSPTTLSAQQANKHASQSASASTYTQQHQQPTSATASAVAAAAATASGSQGASDGPAASSPNSTAAPRSISGASHQHHQHAGHHGHHRSHHNANGGVMNQLPLHSPRSPAGAGMPIPGSSPGGRRRGSDSSSEGFRDVLGSDKWYIGGRTATGEERFFKLGVVRRVRSNDGLSLDRLSL